MLANLLLGLQREAKVAEDDHQRALLTATSLHHEELVVQLGKRSKALGKKSADYMRLKEAYYRYQSTDVTGVSICM